MGEGKGWKSKERRQAGIQEVRGYPRWILSPQLNVVYLLDKWLCWVRKILTLGSHVSDLQQFLPPRMLGAALKGSGATAQVVHGCCPFCCPLNAEDIGRQEHGFNIQSWGRVSYREDGRSWINGGGVDGELGSWGEGLFSWNVLIRNTDDRPGTWRQKAGE